MDSAGNVFATDVTNNIVVKINPNGVITVVAGNNIRGFSGDEGPATNASLNLDTISALAGLAVDEAGNLYIADNSNQRIRKVSPDGVISTVAGNGRGGFSGDGGPATSASLSNPTGVALDNAGNLYVADVGNHRIRKVAPDGIISTVAGNGTLGFSGDGGPATNASLANPTSVALDASGNLYIADRNNQLVRKVSPDGIITTVAGNGVRGFSGDGGPATNASLSLPRGVAADEIGNLYIADGGNTRIRKVSPDGIISTVAGGSFGFSGDDGPAVGAAFNNPFSVVVAFGNLYIADSNNGRIRKVGTDGIVTTIAGIGLTNFSGDGGPATIASLSQPQDLAVDGTGTLFIADQFNHRVRKVGATGTIATAAGTGTPAFSGDGGLATSARLNFPRGVAVDAAGNLYIADSTRIRKVNFLGNITTVAGGRGGFSGDGGPATAAALSNPYDVALDQVGNLYIADRSNNRVRKVDLAGVITTVAGSGPVGNTVGNFSGDGGPATNALLAIPEGIALDAAGNLYIADNGNSRIRKVTPDGIIITVAGGGSLSSERVPATSASLNSPKRVTVDLSGNLFIAETGNHRIRKVGPDGIITTVAGNRVPGFSGDGGPATGASLNSPWDVAVDRAGNLFIADLGNDRIRVVLAAPPSFAVAPTALNFAVSAGTQEISPQRIVVSSVVSGLAWSAASSTESGGNWLTISPVSGSTPGTIDVAANATNLAAGTYRGAVTITAPNASPPVLTVAVTFSVSAANPPRLAVELTGLSFSFTQQAGAASAQLSVSNRGSGSLDFTASATTNLGGGWLTVAPASGSVTAFSTVTLTVTASPAGLGPDTYTGTISLVSPTTGQTINLPVNMIVSGVPQTILLSQTGLTFTVVAGGGAIPPQTFGVLNTGRGIMNWTVRASTLSEGPTWLTATPENGSTDATALRVPLVEVGVNPAGLAPGDYYGQVQVSAATADNSPQLLSVILKILPTGSNPGPLVRPTGLIFTGLAGGTSPGSQNVVLSVLTGVSSNFISGRLTQDGKDWFVTVPATDTVAPGRPTRVIVQPDLRDLDAGVRRGVLTLLFSEGAVQTVNLLFVLIPGGGISPQAFGRAAEGCAPTRLLPLFTSLPTNFSLPTGWPNPIEVRVVDDCGNPMVSGSVVVTFSNGDAPVVLNRLGEGRWSGTWQPRNATQGQLIVKVLAEIPAPKIQGTAQVTGGLQANPNVPVVGQGAIVNAASFAPQAPVAPGSLVSIFGSKLSEGQGAAARLPLETQLAGTRVSIGGQPMPLLYAGDGQINAVVPYGLAVNTRYQVVVQRGSSYSVPEPITVAAAQPAVFTKDQSGKGQGLVFVSTPAGLVLAEAASPARAGDAVVIYCSGLGEVNPPVAAGAAAPASPLSVTANPVSVTMGGREAQVLFAGLSPGFAGLYQVNAVVPPGISPGNETPVSLTVAGQTPPPVTMAVR
ncbi:MAG: hypothetical protein A3H28_01925 [Acidobacteria bacterium RIFCSPLOWO2_02_FULL_61_28]|nr:MAG: hypothetical protein A3H28_01925 [Acidobacteria bacterium RIFCSPLOWO2_02_FULL_61_28]